MPSTAFGTGTGAGASMARWTTPKNAAAKPVRSRANCNCSGADGLIRRAPKTHRYQLTEKGRQIVTAPSRTAGQHPRNSPASPPKSSHAVLIFRDSSAENADKTAFAPRHCLRSARKLLTSEFADERRQSGTGRDDLLVRRFGRSTKRSQFAVFAHLRPLRNLRFISGPWSRSCCAKAAAANSRQFWDVCAPHA